MTKRIIIIICGLIILIAGVVYQFLPNDTGEIAPTPPSPGQDPFGTPAGSVQIPSPSGGTSSGQNIFLQTVSGQAISIPDPTVGKPSVIIGVNRFYALTSNQESDGSAALFDITYGTDSSISVTLLKEPLGRSRLAAEAVLRQFVPLPNEQLCSLNIIVAVPFDVSDRYPGANLGLSFCPGAVALPI